MQELSLRRVVSEIFFKKRVELTDSLNPERIIDPRVRPSSLLNLLHSKRSLKYFIQQMGENEKDGWKVLHRMTVMHWCLVYDATLCEDFKQINFKKCMCEDEWLNSNLLSHYSLFLQRICYTQQIYQSLRLNHILVFTLEKLFIVRKLLVNLFAVVKKIDGLQLYYEHQADKLQWKHINQFVAVMSFHAQELYAIFKAILGQMIRFPVHYLDTPDKVGMVRYLLKHELDLINQDMKALFLNKNFQPVSKGYGVQLLKLDELPEHTRDYVQSIVCPLKRKKRRRSIDSYFFDQSGRVSRPLLQGLKQQLTQNSNAGEAVTRFRRRHSMSQQIQVI